jgi:hypothetical protein
MGGALDGNTGEERLVWAGNAGYLQRMHDREHANARMISDALHLGQALLPAQSLNE